MQIASSVLYTVQEPAYSSRAEKASPQRAGTESDVGATSPVTETKGTGVSNSRAPSPVAQSDTDIRQQQSDADLIRQLQSRDTEVRNHERAHQAVGGAAGECTDVQFY